MPSDGLCPLGAGRWVELSLVLRAGRPQVLENTRSQPGRGGQQRPLAQEDGCSHTVVRVAGGWAGTFHLLTDSVCWTTAPAEGSDAKARLGPPNGPERMPPGPAWGSARHGPLCIRGGSHGHKWPRRVFWGQPDGGRQGHQREGRVASPGLVRREPPKSLQSIPDR